ncbi:MAG TPA: hypothetical protein VFD80_06440 [Flavobacteriaceae bacterium]|nr:hypothetical protein [Flavobacteriaceae bacterium]
MKYQLLLALSLCLLISNLHAQKATVEKSHWGVQVGIHPLAFYNETKLLEKITLRTELGFGFGWSGFGNSAEWAVIPVIGIEPRFYYNLQKRMDRGKRTDGNSGNFVSLHMGYVPDFKITSHENVIVYPAAIILPMWGLKRSVGKHFNFETACGIGYNWTFKEYTIYNGEKISYTDKGLTFGFRLAFGYKIAG